MAGTKRERSPGVWELRVHLGRDPVTRKRVDVSRTFRGGERAAGRALAQLVTESGELAAERMPTETALEEMTVAQLLARWQELRVAEWAPSTAHDHAGTVDRYLVPHIGQVRVVELRRPRVEEFYALLARRGGKGGRPLSARSVGKVHSVLHAALEDAVRLELIAGNPASKARRPRVPKHQAVVPSLDQIRSSIDLATDSMPTLIRMAIATGARRGELAALRWSDLDLDHATVHIQAAATRLPGQPVRTKSTKTNATGVLALDPGTITAMRAWRTELQQRRLALGLGRLTPTDWVWPAKDHRSPIDPDAITYQWSKIRARVGMDDVRFHDLRHAAATHMVAAGIDVRTVAGRLRHASPAMTLDVYAGRDLDADRAAAVTMGGLLDG